MHCSLVFVRIFESLIYVPKKAYIEIALASGSEISISVSSWTPDFRLPTYDDNVEVINIHEDYINGAGQKSISRTSSYDKDEEVTCHFKVGQVMEADVFVGHGAVVGSKNADIISPYVFNSGFKQSELEQYFTLSVLGDIHHGQLFKDSSGSTRICVPGNPIMTTYKDDPNCVVS